MLRFVRGAAEKLFHWAGIIQRTAVKPLCQSSHFTESDVRSLIPFCFPTAEPMSGPLFYVFRFKPSDGHFYNVFCLLDQTSFAVRDLETSQSCCLCLISSLSHFSIFEEILRAVRSLLLQSAASSIRFLETIRRSPAQVPTIRAAPPPAAQLSALVAFATASLSSVQLGRLVIGLLTDTPIIVISSDLSRLSRFCYALVALISPLEWRHLFAPVLPGEGIASIQSPAPFIVGLHRLLVPRVAGCRVDGHLLVDLDDRSVAAAGLDPLPPFASQLLGSAPDSRALIAPLLCRAAGVQPATSPRIVARRIIAQLDADPPDPASFAGCLFGSRTVSELVGAMRAPHLSAHFAGILAAGAEGALTSPAVQRLEDFPVRVKGSRTSKENRFPRADEDESTSSSAPVVDIAAECAT
jgi:hypothetical protein